jgi:hypothetical protein
MAGVSGCDAGIASAICAGDRVYGIARKSDEVWIAEREGVPSPHSGIVLVPVSFNLKTAVDLCAA